MEYLTVKEVNSTKRQQSLKIAKRKYSCWVDDHERLSVVAESNVEKQQRLSKFIRRRSQWVSEDKEAFLSLLSLQGAATVKYQTFCSETISVYDPWLQNANNVASFAVFALMFVISYMFFFSASEELFTGSIFSDIYYSFIVLLQSRTGYLVDGVEERDLCKVRNKYHQSMQFYLDMFSFLPVGPMAYLFPGSDQIFYAIGRQKSYGRIYFVLCYLGLREEEPGSSTLLYRSVRLILVASLTIHFTGCVWYGIACTRYDDAGFNVNLCNKDSWIFSLPHYIVQKISFASGNATSAVPSEVSYLYDTYVTSLYWATTTTTSTGYGDITAQTVIEKIVSIIAMIIGMLTLYGMTMGGMTSMLTNIDSKRSSYIHTYKAFKDEVKRMGVSSNLTNACLRYYNFLWRRWGGENVQTNGVLDILPQPLRAKFSEATYHLLIEKATRANKNNYTSYNYEKADCDSETSSVSFAS